jgi:hypothetical protein
LSYPNLYKNGHRIGDEVKEMKRMVAILLIAGLLMGAVGVALCENVTSSGNLTAVITWSGENSPDTIPCGGGGGSGAGGIPG